MVEQTTFLERIDVHRIKTLILSDYSLLFLTALFYIIVVSSVAISRHYAFQTNAWDLGIYSQSLYTTLNHGKLLYYTTELPGNPSGSLFGIHFSPFLFLLVPIYALFQNPVTLLILRPVAISLGLIPLYWILRDQKLNTKLVTLFFAIVYVVYPPINAPISNFDVEVFLPALFLFSLYYLRKGKLVHSYFFVVLSLMVNEFVPLIVIAMAVYYFLLKRAEIIGGLRSKKLTKNAIFVIILLLSGLLWFTLAGSVISSFNPTALNTKWEWGEFGNSPGEIVTNVVANPAKTFHVLLNDGQNKFLYITSLFGPLAFLSFLDPLTLIMTGPWLAASLLSINPLYYTIGTQYPAFVSPFLFVAAINGIKKLGSISGRDILRTIGFLMVVSLIVSILLLPASGDFSVTESEDTTRLALNKIPPIASVSVMPELYPHVCNRLEVYPYFQSGVDYVLVNVYSWWYTATLPRPAHVAPKWRDAEIGNEYGIVVNANGILLYKKGYSGPLEHFEGVNFTYTYENAQIATGNLALKDVDFEGSVTKTEIFVHASTDPTPLFFSVPENVLPPGSYNGTVVLKVSSINSDEAITLAALKQPEDSAIFTMNIRGNDFTDADTWQAFTFNFTLEQPTFIKFDAYVSNSTDVSFYYMNILQVSGGV